MSILFQEALEQLKTIETLYAKNKPEQAESLQTQLLEAYKIDVNVLKCLNKIFQTIKNSLLEKKIATNIEYNTPHGAKKYGEFYSAERYQQILPYCELAYLTEKNGSPEEHALKLSVLFDNTSEVLTYLIKSAKNKLLVHDACAFNLPDISQCNFKAWKKIIKKNIYDHVFLKLLINIPKLEKLILENKLQPGQKLDRAALTEKKKQFQQVNVKFKALKRRHGTLSSEEEKEYRNLNQHLLTLKKELFKLSAGVKLSEVDLPLLVACKEVWMDTQELGIVREMMLKNGLTIKDYEKFLKLDRQHAGENIPEIALDGADNHYPGTYLMKVSTQNTQQAARAAYLGKLTACCQSLSGEAGEPCAIHGLTSPHGGFYVLFAGDLNHPKISDPVLAQCWVWRSQSDALVFDSVEYDRSPGKIDTTMITTLYKRLAKQLVQNGYTHKVAMGVRSGIGLKFKGNVVSHSEREHFIDYKGYNDSAAQTVLYDKNKLFYTYNDDAESRLTLDRHLTEIMQDPSPLVKSDFLEILLNWLNLNPSQRPLAQKMACIAKENNREHELISIIKVLHDYVEHELKLTTENISSLIEKNSFFLSMTTQESGATPLHSVIRSTHDALSTVALLLEHGAPIEKTDKRGDTPLHYACQEGNEAIVKLLLEKNASVYIRNNEGETPFDHACRKGNIAIIKLFLKENISINTQNEDGNTPLHHACRKNHESLVQLLLEEGADLSVNMQNGQGNTPLHEACQNGNEIITKLLLEDGANLSVNMRSGQGNTPLHEACQNGNEIIAKLLLGRKASINIENGDGDTPLHLACENNHESIVKLLLIMGRGKEAARINTVNHFGNTPLHYACENENESIVKLLLGKGASVDIKNKLGNTSLHYACENENESIVKLLLAKGACVDIVNEEGDTPLDKAYQSGNEAIIKILLEHAAYLGAKNNTSLLSSNVTFFNCPQPIEKKAAHENDRPLPRL